ncbi:MAG TPA: cupin domain-containing protein [Candidatus Acidoferrales bacterium]|nr:cupin domain-containing protein [Candidatus Acidoferrales bacterium]
MTATATGSSLHVYRESDAAEVLLETYDGDRIAGALREIGVRFERWAAGEALAPGAGQDDILAAYRSPVERLMAECGYASVDVIRVEPGAPNAAELRAKFLDEHRHDDDEVRFFVEGRGAFYLHAADRVYRVVCTRGDLISVPAGTRHWFDMGPDPQLAAIRLFVTPEGWVAKFTGDPIAQRFPKLEP